MQAKNKEGFTLMELTVVIIILAIIATVLTPTLNRILASARDTKRIADCSEYINILQNFYNENGFFPGGVGDPSFGENYTGKIPDVDIFVESIIPFTTGNLPKDPRGNTEVFYYHYSPETPNFYDNNALDDLITVHVQTLEIKSGNTDPETGNFPENIRGPGNIDEADYVLALEDPKNIR